MNARRSELWILSSLLLLLLLLLSRCQTVSSDGSFNVYLSKYQNPNSVLSNNEKCDTFGGFSPCDMRFTISYRVGSDAKAPAYTSPEFSDSIEVNGIFNLNSSFTGAFPITSDNWYIRVDVVDIDPPGTPYQSVDDIILSNSLEAIRSSSFNGMVPSWTTITTDRNYGRLLTWSHQLYCSVNYYSGLCDKFCKPTDNTVDGHYSCSSTGDKVCLQGYWDPATNCKNTYCMGTTLCQNNATCNPLETGYTCNCPEKFTGRHCELFKNPCLGLAPCRNGSCTNPRDGEYTCSCYSGWTGVNCDVDVDECTSGASGCDPAGTMNCTNLIGSFECKCRDGWSGSRCASISDHCSVLSPCKYGSCVNANVSITGSNYTCHCQSGWAGRNCDTDVDECATAGAGSAGSCHTLGTSSCVNTNGSFSCTCRPGWAGPLCNSIADYCLVMKPTCNHGNCSNGGGGSSNFTCVCQSGWEGATCDTDINECSRPGYCVNRAGCENRNGSYVCHCLPGFDGPRCDTKVNPCLTERPCANGGNCTPVVDSTGGGGSSNFTCVCQSGWEGATCDTDINECSRPGYCVNRAGCENRNGSYVCHCLPGFDGPRCDTKVNPCLTERPCANGGNCTPVVDSTGGGGSSNFTCVCQSGWEGATCDTDINECSRPGYCVNRAGCDNRNGSYVCHCLPGFDGPRCDIRVNPCLTERPCANGGNCTLVVDSTGPISSCSCSSGWEGRNCTFDKNECSSGPCSFGQVCVNLPGTYRCDQTAASYWWVFLIVALIILLAIAAIVGWRVIVCHQGQKQKKLFVSSGNNGASAVQPRGTFKWPVDDRKTFDDWRDYSYNGDKSPALPPRSPNRVRLPVNQPSAAGPTPADAEYNLLRAAGASAAPRPATSVLDDTGIYTELRNSKMLGTGETPEPLNSDGPRPPVPNAPRPTQQPAEPHFSGNSGSESEYDNGGYLFSSPPSRPVSNPVYLIMTNNPDGYVRPISFANDEQQAPPPQQLPPKPPKVKRTKRKKAPLAPQPEASEIEDVATSGPDAPAISLPEIHLIDCDGVDAGPPITLRLNSGDASERL